MKTRVINRALSIILLLTTIPSFCAAKRGQPKPDFRKQLAETVHEFTKNIESNKGNVDSFTRPMLAQKRLAASELAEVVINQKITGLAIQLTFACYDNDLAFCPDTANRMDVFLKNQSDFYQQRKNEKDGQKKPYQQPKDFRKLEQEAQKNLELMQKIFNARKLIALSLTRIAPAPQERVEQKMAIPVRAIRILQRPAQNPKTIS